MAALTRFQNTVAKRWYFLDESWRYSITVFLVARLLLGLWSWVVYNFQPVAIQNLELSGEPILSIFEVKASQSFIYLREVNGTVLTFRPLGSDLIVDQQTGTIWETSTGKGSQGQYRGSTLLQAKTRASDIFPYHGTRRYPGVWLALWQRFDANWYTSIAENGYGSIPGDDHFPPLFPLLIRSLMPVFGNAFLAGLFLSHLATFISIKFLYDTFSQWGEKAVGKRAVLFFVIYPTFFFFYSAYSESVFLLAALLSLRAMRKRSWLWAGFWIFCATLTRLQGVALLAPLLYLLWQDRPMLRKPAHWFGPVVAGMGGFFYLYGRSMQGIHETLPLVESDWHAHLVPPWQTYGYALQTILSGAFSFIDFLNWAVVTLFICLLVWGWRKIPLEYNLYTTFSLFIILSRIVETQPLISMSRYSLTLFPVFYVLGLAGENPYLRRVILYGFILLALYLTAQFFLWGWVA